MSLLKKGDVPNFKGDGVAVWVNQTQNGEDYLSISILGGLKVNAFKYTPKEKKPSDDVDK